MTSLNLTRLQREIACTGFDYAADARAARRQFRLSVGVVVSLAAGIVAATLNLGIHPVSASKTEKASTVLSMAGPVHTAGRIVALGS